MSDLLKDPFVLRQIIMDHYENPRNHSLTKSSDYIQKHMASESCIDDIHVEVKLEGNVITDVRFDGVACTIRTASTSIMSEMMQGKTLQQARELLEEYKKMVNGKEYNEELLEEAVAFSTVWKQANRIKCATIGWNAMEEILEESEQHGKQQ